MGVLPLMRRAIRQKAAFDINDLDTLALAPPPSSLPRSLRTPRGTPSCSPTTRPKLRKPCAVSAWGSRWRDPGLPGGQLLGTGLLSWALCMGLMSGAVSGAPCHHLKM